MIDCQPVEPLVIEFHPDDSATVGSDLRAFGRRRLITDFDDLVLQGQAVEPDLNRDRRSVPEKELLYVNLVDEGAVAVVLDAANGSELASLPIGGWADGVFVDQQRRRIYVSTGVGHVETYTIAAHDVYRRLEPVDTAVMAKTGLYSSELDRMYVSVPHLGGTPAQIMILKPIP